VSACGPRQAEVRTAPTTAEAAIHFTNNLSQAVNVYVVQGGTEMFVRQVAGNTTEHLPVRGVAAGAQVRLRAVTIDGKSQFDSPTTTLTSMYTWKVP
jgi:queuine/archaeosine tRNA-ribosyltransferase